MSVVPPSGIVRKYYEEAAQDIEYKSSAFWQVWLQREFARDFRELDLYAVTSESSPDGSLRRVDQVVKRYDPSHHNLSSMVWNECKRRTGSAKEAEKQALDAAIRCIKKENLLWIYALTTVGVTFRVWKVNKEHLRLESLHADRDWYIDADSPHAWTLREAIQGMKDMFPLGDAGIVPSQSHLLGKLVTGMEQSSMPEAQWLIPEPFMPEHVAGEGQMQGTQQWPAAGFGLQDMPPPPLPAEYLGQQEIPLPPMPAEGLGQQDMAPPLEEYGRPQLGQGDMQETYYSGEGEGSTAITNTGTQSIQAWSKVDVRKIGHMTRRDEHVFKTDSGYEKSTDRADWREIKHKGKQAWYYRYKGIYYYTREKPGG